MSQHKHICAAMSGGVDSSVAALLTRDAGHNITGVTLRLHDKQGCGSGDDAQQAADIWAKMGAITTFVNAIVAVIAATLLYTALRKALQKTNLLPKL